MKLDGKMDLEDYIEEESEGKPNRLMTEAEVLERLQISPRHLCRLRHGRNRRGIKLNCIDIGHQTRRYRLRDVLTVEWEFMK